MRKFVAAGIVLAIGASAVQAQRGGERLSQQCRREVVQLCGMNRGAMRACLQENAARLSKTCQAEISARFQKRFGEREARATPKLKAAQAALGAVEHAYGADPLQKLDFYSLGRDGRGDGAKPLIVFVHGGGWKRGDKGNATGVDKIKFFRAQGYQVASINYRLVPQNTVEQQAADVAQALGWLRGNARKFDIDPRRIVLMGHSAGAHLVALVGTDPRYLRGAGLGLEVLAGIVPVDGAAYDVPAQMKDGNRIMQETYGQAFGTDPARQRALSPTYHAGGPNAPSFLILHVQRPDGARQSAALGEALRKAGTPAQVNGFPGEGMQGHRDINVKLGDPSYPATPVLGAWLKQALG